MILKIGIGKVQIICRFVGLMLFGSMAPDIKVFVILLARQKN